MTDNDFPALVASIAETNRYFQQQAQKQVNVALTLRNWLIGAYLFEYEQNGRDRAVYGEGLYKRLAAQLQASGVAGASRSNLHLFRQFYLGYPEIVQTVSGQLQSGDETARAILDRVSSKTATVHMGSIVQSPSGQLTVSPGVLINQLSFSHIIELLKADSPLKRAF
ncbi:MAG TPA: DUF1016 N-terminal domain-containing protein [Fluviicoccus sp.]|nr:DUF1016 N-terminal domain-containing protein [Fluviicoccus sp.]